MYYIYILKDVRESQRYEINHGMRLLCKSLKNSTNHDFYKYAGGFGIRECNPLSQ